MLELVAKRARDMAVARVSIETLITIILSRIRLLNKWRDGEGIIIHMWTHYNNSDT